jgi:hypothetical protein
LGGRDAERGRLAGAGSSLHGDVLAVEDARDRLGLDGRGLVEALAVDRVERALSGLIESLRHWSALAPRPLLRSRFSDTGSLQSPSPGENRHRPKDRA